MLRLLRVPGRRHSLRFCAHGPAPHPSTLTEAGANPQALALSACLALLLRDPGPLSFPSREQHRGHTLPTEVEGSMHCSRPQPLVRSARPRQGSPHPCPSCAFPRGRTFSGRRGSDAADSSSGLPAGRPVQAPHLGTRAGPRPKPREGLCFPPGSAGPPQTSELKRVPQEPSLSCSTGKQGARTEEGPPGQGSCPQLQLLPPPQLNGPAASFLHQLETLLRNSSL